MVLRSVVLRSVVWCVVSSVKCSLVYPLEEAKTVALNASVEKSSNSAPIFLAASQ